LLAQESSNKDASRPHGISTFPWTPESLEVADTNLRLKWIGEKTGTEDYR
jgi:hypothetical protein